MFKLSKIKNVDFPILLYIIILATVGLLNVFATTYSDSLAPSGFFYSQIVFNIVGAILMFFTIAFDYRVLKKPFFILLIYSASIGLLLAVLFLGEYVLGARRWLSIGGFTIQPSEFAKLTVIVVTAYILQLEFSKRHKTFIKFCVAALLTLPIIILTFMQNSLGNTILISLIFLSVSSVIIKKNFTTASYLLIALLGINLSFGFINIGNKLKELVLANQNVKIEIITAIITIILVAVLIYKLKLKIVLVTAIFITFLSSSLILNYSYNNVLKPYHRARIESFVNPELDPNQSWNQRQAIIASGSGTLFGKGFLKGTHSYYKFLPLSYNDFAFAAYAEQFGFVGSVSLLIVFSILTIRVINLTEHIKDDFGKLVLFGVCFMLLYNTVQHVGMNLGYLPITGVPLPFISHGGSTTLSYFIAVGLVLSVKADSANVKTKVIKKTFRRKKAVNIKMKHKILETFHKTAF